MTTVWLIRHGQTTTSGHSYAGRSDVPLTPEGHAQARAIAIRMRGQALDLILCSPLRRALDTAQPLSDATGCTITVTADMAELDFGDYEGLPKASLSLNLRRSSLTQPLPGGESLRDLWIRTGRVAGVASAMPPGAHVAIVGHHWSNRLLYGHLAGLQLAEAAASRAYRPKTGTLCPVVVARSPGPGTRLPCHFRARSRWHPDPD